MISCGFLKRGRVAVWRSDRSLSEHRRCAELCVCHAADDQRTGRLNRDDKSRIAGTALKCCISQDRADSPRRRDSASDNSTHAPGQGLSYCLQSVCVVCNAKGCLWTIGASKGNCTHAHKHTHALHRRWKRFRVRIGMNAWKIEARNYNFVPFFGELWSEETRVLSQ